MNQQWITSSLRGDRRAQRRLYDALLPYLRAVCQRYLRDVSYERDALQETFVRLFRALPDYDSRRGSFKNWAAKLAVRASLNVNERRLDPNVQYPGADAHPEPRTTANEPPFDPFVVSDERLLYVLRRMPPGYFEVFNLAVIDEYGHAEIAELIDVTPENSRQLLRRARRWLQTQGPQLLRQYDATQKIPSHA